MRRMQGERGTNPWPLRAAEQGALKAPPRLAGRVAVLTGCSRSYATALARTLGGEGADLAVHFRGEPELTPDTLRELALPTARVLVLSGDLLRPEDCHRLIERTARELGRVDILVNANQAAHATERTVRRMSAAEWDEALAARLSSVFHCTRAALEPMVERGWGRIVNVASKAGQSGAFGQAHAAAAHAGVVAFTRGLAAEVARNGITANVLCPDAAAARPADELARAARFLCTDGEWVNGAQLNIEAGVEP